MNLYTNEAIGSLLSQYINAGGEVYEMREGVLGHGDLLLYDFSGKLKTIVIREVATNEWSSAHIVRTYNKMPAKYLKMLEAVGIA